MVIIVNKSTDQKQLESELKLLEDNRKELKLKDFLGKLKTTFGDGVHYQRKLRDEWD
jgi:hypothetical protein